MSSSLRRLLLATLASIISFSPLLADAAANITRLPGFNGSLPFQFETGYERVGGDLEFFYYFVESERKADEDPILLWLTGGPGCSSLSGLFYEIGPLRFVHSEYDDRRIPSLHYHPDSWTKIANIIFLDSPVGTGFSYLDSPRTFEVDDTLSSIQVCDFLVKWYYSHRRFRSNDLYIAGSSYAGKIVPIITYAIIEDKRAPMYYNLKGYIIGNPLTDVSFDFKARVESAYGFGIIPKDLYKVIGKYCEGEEDYEHPSPHNLPCNMALAEFDKLYAEINSKYILDPKCFSTSEEPSVSLTRRSLAEEKYKVPVIEAPDFQCKIEYAHYLSYYWANNEETKEALQVREGTVKQWLRCNRDINYSMNIKSSLKYHHHLIERGYRALVYSGDHDLSIPFLGTHAWITSLNFPIIDDWRSWQVDGQVAGYTRRFMNDLTFATIKNAGHEAPCYQPKSSFMMFDRWISYKRI